MTIGLKIVTSASKVCIMFLYRIFHSLPSFLFLSPSFSLPSICPSAFFILSFVYFLLNTICLRIGGPSWCQTMSTWSEWVLSVYLLSYLLNRHILRQIDATATVLSITPPSPPRISAFVNPSVSIRQRERGRVSVRENLFAKIINNNMAQWKVQWQVARGSIDSINAGHPNRHN